MRQESSGKDEVEEEGRGRSSKLRTRERERERSISKEERRGKHVSEQGSNETHTRQNFH